MTLPDPPPLEIGPHDLDSLRRESAPCMILDVREPAELQICGFEEAVNIPLGELPGRTSEVPHDRPVVVVCRTGRRSLEATRFLRSNGFGNATNLAGGVHAWSDAIDPEMQKY